MKFLKKNIPGNFSCALMGFRVCKNQFVCLFVLVKKGDRIAQLILERIAIAEVEEVDDLEESTRGSGGFGSTGVKRLKPDTSVDKKMDKTMTSTTNQENQQPNVMVDAK